MRKHVLFELVLAAVFFSTAPLYAEQIGDKNFYAGIGGTWALEDFKGGGYDDTWGMNFKFGYNLHPMADIEFDFDVLDEFEEVEGFSSQNAGVNGDANLNVRTYMVALKGYFPISSDQVRLSVVVGAGIMTVDSDFQAGLDGGFRRDGIDETDPCGKVGLALDFYATREISIGVEGNYTLGFFDVEDIRYFHFILGAAYHF
jgi:opacity protein-like surface antigen